MSLGDIIRVKEEEITSYPSYSSAYGALYGPNHGESLGQLLFWTGLRSLLIMPGVWFGLKLARAKTTPWGVVLPSVLGSAMVSMFVLIRMGWTKHAEVRETVESENGIPADELEGRRRLGIFGRMPHRPHHLQPR